jgi:hypothetical protein
MKKSKILVVSQALVQSDGGSPMIINNFSFTPPFYAKYFNPLRLPLIGKYILCDHDCLLKFIHPF